MHQIDSIAVIGAGPSGLYTASLLKEYANNNNIPLTIDIYERTAKAKRHPVCTGLFTKEIEKFFSYRIDSYDFYVNTLRQASITTSCNDNETNHNNLLLPVEEFLVDRKAFDEHLSKTAVKAGCTIYYRSTITNIATQKKPTLHTLTIKTDKKTCSKTYSLVIIASGPSHIPINLKNEKPFPHLLGAQYHITTKTRFQTPDRFTCFFEKSNPDFFYWVVPEDAHHLRIGTAAQNDAKTKLDTFLKRYAQSTSMRIQKKTFEASVIPLFSQKRRRERLRLRKQGLYYCGDAALSIKDTTGGGVVPGLSDAQLITEHIIKQIEKTKLKRLQHRFRSGYLSFELLIHQTIMQLLKRNGFRGVKRLATALSRPSLQKIIQTTPRDRIITLTFQLLVRNPLLPWILLSPSFPRLRHKKTKRKERFI
jgi:flavin-dependent dehydrogenase